jgi:RNA polymerase sigma factor (sigma-70 family)
METRDFESFFEAERAGLFRALVLVTGSSQEAEDLMQEAFVQVWERWTRVSQTENPLGYLHRTAMNAFRSRYRHVVFAARRRFMLTTNIADPLLEVEARDVAARALRVLTRRQRAAVVLTELLGYTTNEAAALLSIRPGTVRTLVSQARARLRTVIEHPDV